MLLPNHLDRSDRSLADKDQLKFPQYVAAFLGIPSSVTDRDIIPAFQVFDIDRRGVLDADEMMKQLTNVGEPLDEAEAKAFKDNLKIDERGLFDYTGKADDVTVRCRICSFRILPQVHAAVENEEEEVGKEEEEEIEIKPNKKFFIFVHI